VELLLWVCFELSIKEIDRANRDQSFRVSF
jgi:hypothetical protein